MDSKREGEKVGEVNEHTQSYHKKSKKCYLMIRHLEYAKK